MFRFLTFRRKSRRPPVPVPVTLPSPMIPIPSTQRQNRISTLSNATTLHPSNPQSELPATLLSSFPAPPSSTSPFLPIQQNTTTLTPNQNQTQPTNTPQYPHTFLPNISQSSLDTLADPLGRLPNAPNRLSTFEAFLNHARMAEMARQERERYMVRMWQAAEEERRRQAGRSLSGDPWRGRFGPAAGEVVGIGLGIGMGGFGQEVRRERERGGEGGVRRERSGGKVAGAKVWLRKVTSLERLRV